MIKNQNAKSKVMETLSDAPNLPETTNYLDPGGALTELEDLQNQELFGEFIGLDCDVR